MFTTVTVISSVKRNNMEKIDIKELSKKFNNELGFKLNPSNDTMTAVREARKLFEEYVTDILGKRVGWKGWTVVDPEADNYKYSPVFSTKDGAELWLKGKSEPGLKVIEVDIVLPWSA